MTHSFLKIVLPLSVVLGIFSVNHVCKYLCDFAESITFSIAHTSTSNSIRNQTGEQHLFTFEVEKMCILSG